jgi:hypothetical protein
MVQTNMEILLLPIRADMHGTIRVGDARITLTHRDAPGARFGRLAFPLPNACTPVLTTAVCLVCLHKQGRRNDQAEGLGGLEIDG